MPRNNPAYPPEFRREAIRLVRASGEEHPIPGIAREIGVSDGTLRNWVNQEEIDSGQREGLTAQEKEELQAERQAHSEAHRLLAAALERIPSIEARQETSEATEAAEEQQGRASPLRYGWGSEEGVQRPWWRKLIRR